MKGSTYKYKEHLFARNIRTKESLEKKKKKPEYSNRYIQNQVYHINLSRFYLLVLFLRARLQSVDEGSQDIH